jgi:hypothetical protein
MRASIRDALRSSTVAERLDARWDEIVAIMPEISMIGSNPVDRETNIKKSKEYILNDYISDIVDYKPNFAPRGSERRKLDRVAKKTRALMLAIGELEPAMRKEIGADDIGAVSFLRLLRKASMNSALAQVKRTGGSRQRRTDRAIKKWAAELAHEMIFEWIGVIPTLTPTGPWIRLTKLFVEIGTGHDLGDVYRPCADYLKELKDRGTFSLKDRREATRPRS